MQQYYTLIYETGRQCSSVNDYCRMNSHQTGIITNVDVESIDERAHVSLQQVPVPQHSEAWSGVMHRSHDVQQYQQKRRINCCKLIGSAITQLRCDTTRVY